MVDDLRLDNLENDLPDEIFGRMFNACRDRNPLEKMKEVLRDCREKPYFDDAIGYAKVMLLLERHGRSYKPKR